MTDSLEFHVLVVVDPVVLHHSVRYFLNILSGTDLILNRKLKDFLNEARMTTIGELLLQSVIPRNTTVLGIRGVKYATLNDFFTICSDSSDPVRVG